MYLPIIIRLCLVFQNKEQLIGKNHIEDWELALVQHLFKNKLKKLKYKIYKYDKRLVKKGIGILKSDKLLKKNLNNFLKKWSWSRQSIK